MSDAKENTRKKPAPEETLEGLLAKLEAVVSDLEKGETGLEQSLDLFEKGMALVKVCNQRLESAEQRILLVTRGQDDTVNIEKHQHQATHEGGPSTGKGR